ncbi:hypothetical protein Trydic_g23552 [Trypoxylus dichotomus]
MAKVKFLLIALLYKFVRTIHVHSAGEPYEYGYPNSILDEEDAIDAYAEGSENVEKYQYPSHTENHIYPYGNVNKDYGVINMTFLGSQLQSSFQDGVDRYKNTKSTKNRVGFYNVQTGDEFFLNDFEVRPKFKTKQSNKQVLGYEYIANGSADRNDQVSTQKTTTTKKPQVTDNPRYGMKANQRPQQTNNRRKNTNKVTNKRRRPVIQNTKKQPTVNGNKNTVQKNTNNRKNTLQNNRKKPQPIQNVGNRNGCRNPNNPFRNPNNRRPTINSNRITNNNRNKLQNQTRKPVRKVNNNRQRENAKASNERQRSLFSMTLNQIGSQSMNFANRFLSFFNVVQYPNYQCIADSDFNYYEGTCYQEKQCRKLGGTPLGNCSSYDTCCVFKSTCGEVTNHNCTYLESPDYPHFFPNNSTGSFDDPDYELEETTEEGTEGYDYEPGNSIIEEDVSATPTSSEDTPDNTKLSTDHTVGDEFFMETESLTDVPLMGDEENNQDMTENPFAEDFEITETIDWLQENKYKEYALARQDYLAENFACTFKVFKASEKVQQMKIHFIDLELLGPNESGDCLQERLMIAGQNLNTYIPTICGYISGQHVFVDVSTLSGPLQISILSNDVYAKRYKLRVCQLETPCVNSMNCLQYYTGTQGTISSFNYDQAARFPRSDPQYLNNLNYAICIRREAGYCSTTFTNVDEENVEYPFDIRNDNVSVSGGGNNEFGLGHVDCPDDYIVINNIRICGQTFQPVTERGTNPIIIIPVHTNHQSTGMGFKLLYTQNECLI